MLAAHVKPQGSSLWGHDMRALDFRGVEAKVPLKETRIKELVRQGKFPQPCKLSGRKLCWLESEIDAWLAAHFANRTPAEEV